MSNIEFEADMQGNPRYGSTNRPNAASAGGRSGLIGWLVSHGILNSDSAAKAFLIGFVCVNFIATGLILYFYVLR